jgi:hypothetical protein
MKKIKIILGIFVVLFVLFVIAVLVVGAHLGDIIKAGLENAGPRVTQTTLTVDAVDVSLLGGSAGVKGFTLGNPDGFKSPQSISFSNAAISLVPGSVMSDKIVIRSIEVRGAQINFEGNPIGANNLMKIMGNVKAVSGSSAPAGTNAPAPATAANTAPGKKLEVDHFLITGAQVHASLTGLVTKDLTVTIPEIELNDLGKGNDGITAAELTQVILSKITAQTLETLASSVTQLGKDMAEAAKNAAQDTVNNALQNTGIAGTNSVNKLKQGLGGLFGK